MEIREVEEKWWHRLFNVLAGLFWLFLTLVAIYLAWEGSRTHEYSYSWQPSYKSQGVESKCWAVSYPETASSIAYCGDFTKASDIVNSMVSSNFITRPEQIPSPRNEYSDARVIESIEKKAELKYSSYMKTDRSELLEGLFYAGLFSAIVWGSLLGVYKALIYIVHGPRVRLVRRSI
ncbi:TPA: hypothetical protein QDZ75_004194 [Stenotrophomonas maltophilia]|nr:hypothetical protein [Stenotrophomonas maltophilia]